MPRQPTRLHRRLWVVVAAALLPTALLSGAAVLWLQRQQEADVSRATIETMRAMVSAVDGELRNTIAVAQTLVASGALDSGDLPAFYEEAQRIAHDHPQWVTIALSDRSGQQVLNVLEPLNALLPSFAGQESFQRVIATGEPVVGNYDEGPQTGAGFAVRVPVSRDGELIQVLSIVVSPNLMLEVLRKQKVPADGVVSIFDARGNHVARSRAHEGTLGKPGSQSLMRLMAASNEGWGPSLTLEGQRIYAAFSRSAESGWSVAVGIPASEVDAAGSQSLATVCLGLVLSLVIGALASLGMARLVTAPIAALRSAAQAVGRGEVPEVKAMQIAEVNDVAKALVGAARARLQAEQSREELLERERLARTTAEQANKSKDEFLAMLGHELRNPLSAISNALGALTSQKGAREASTLEVKAHGVIRRQVTHLARLVDDLLDVARVVSGKVMLALEAVDVSECVNNSIATLRAGGYLERHSVTVDAWPAWVRADTTRLEQIVNNLVVNAVKYTPEGGSISVTSGERAGSAIIEVRDNGAGIAPDLLPRIFDLFTQGERALDRSQGGLGIGLTLVKRLVQLHGGSVSAVSEGENRGSLFSIRLPRIPAPQSKLDVEPAAPVSTGRVLLVEDNQDARDMLQTLLQAQGHDVAVAADGPEGVERALSFAPRVAFVDLGLPGFDGFEVARRMRAAPPLRNVYLVALSGYGSLEDRRKSQQAGFDLHLVKPVSSDALNRVLAELPRGSGKTSRPRRSSTGS